MTRPIRLPPWRRPAGDGRVPPGAPDATPAQGDPAGTASAPAGAPDPAAAGRPQPPAPAGAPPAAAPAVRVPIRFAESPSAAPRIGSLVEPPAPTLAARAAALPGLRADAGWAADRWIAAASVAGQTHTTNGTSAQDSYSFEVSHDGRALILAVCDGLGSYPATSQIGADLIARFSCAYAAGADGATASEHPEQVLTDALRDASRQVLALRGQLLPDRSDADLSCTAVLCRLPLDGSGEAVVVRAGDCEAFLLTGEEYDVVFPGGPEGPTNVVHHCLPHLDPGERLERARFDPRQADVLILASDGVANDLFDSPGVRAWLTERWAAPCGPVRMADSLRYRCPGSQDDRTALVVWLRPERAGDDSYQPAHSSTVREASGARDER
jgi:serine/threonine protein phosphatase PrpC